MEKLLIVDDEEWILGGLKLMLPWEAMGIELTDTASDGLTAIRIIEKEHPSIVLTDIKMPRMDGLELSKYIYMKKIDCEIILLSGYAEFEYAQKAVAYNVSAYLTKPVIQEELEETIYRMQEKIRQKREQKRILNKFQRTEENKKLSRYYLKEKEGMEEGEKNKAHMSAVFRISSLEGKTMAAEEAEDCFLRFSKEWWDRKQGAVFFQNHSNPNLYIIIVSFSKGLSRQKMSSLLKRDIREFLDSVRRLVRIKGMIGVSEAYEDTNQSFSHYLQAKFIVDNIYESDECAIITIEEFKRKFRNIVIEWDEIRRLVSAVECGDRDSAAGILHFLAEKWKNEESELLATARMNAQEIIMLLFQLLQRYGSNVYELHNRHMDIFSQIWQTTSFDKLEEMLEALLEVVLDTIVPVNNMDGKESVLWIKKHIDEHYQEALSLKSMAELCFMNETYFSRKFKQVVGSNFNDYVRKVRLQRAVEFLETTSMKNHEIAQAVGFSNVNYFLKRFHEEYGVTPKEYKSGRTDGQRTKEE